MLRRRLDLPLDRDGSSRFLPWIVALMVYLSSLALAGTLVVREVVERWDQGLRGTVTVELPAAPAGGKDDGAVNLALGLLRSTPGVVSAEPLDAKRTAQLLAPWLGGEVDLAELPVPRLIDLRIDPNRVDLAALAQRIKAAIPGAEVDDHRRWLDRVIRTGLALQAVAVSIVVLVGAAAVLAVVFATRTGLAVHHSVVEVLHLIGARDGYIARQFEWHALRLGIEGGIVGLLLAVLTVAGVAGAAQRVGAIDDVTRLLPLMEAPLYEWTLLLLLPPAAGLIAMLTARITVLRALARMP
jgi:cell division transport system permease protein